MKELEDVYRRVIITRGENYLPNIYYCIKVGDLLYSEVEGSRIYKTKVNLKTLEGNCSCPYRINCKHAVATYLVYKKGDHIDAASYVEHLNSLSRKELISIIMDGLHNNPDPVLNYSLKKSTDFEDFISEFISDFSYSKMIKAQRLIPYFNFDHLLRMLAFLEENEEEVFDRIYEEYGTADEGEILYDFESKLEEEILKKIATEEDLRKALEIKLEPHQIIAEAERFSKFKEVIKSYFSKDDYLNFLLHLDNPNLSEIRQNITPENRVLILFLPSQNIGLAEKLAVFLNDKSLLLLIAVYKGDYDNTLKYFSEFDKIEKMNGSVWGRVPSKVADMFRNNGLKDEAIAKKLLKRDFLEYYNEKQLRYLSNQIEDYGYIKKQLDLKDRISQYLPLLERMADLNKTETKKIVESENILKRKHWKEVIKVLDFLRRKYGNVYITNLIEQNEDVFKTSSTLKSNLKKEGIVITYSRGRLSVNVR